MCRVIILYQPFNPLSSNDALNHRFTSPKTDSIFLQLEVLEQKFHEIGLPIHSKFLQFLNHIKSSLSTTNSRLVVDVDDNGKFRLERVNRRFRLHSFFISTLNNNF